MMIHGLLDAAKGEFLDWRWNQGALAMESFKEMQYLGEMDGHLSYM